MSEQHRQIKSPEDIQLPEPFDNHDPDIIPVDTDPVNPDNLEKRQHAHKDDVSMHIDREAIIVEADTGKPIMVYLESEDRYLDIPGSLHEHEPSQYTHRQGDNAIETKTRTFGGMPRVPGRQMWCRRAALEREDEDLAARLAYIATELDVVYEQVRPQLYDQHNEDVEEVRPEYKFTENCVFTSGIINFDYSLPYHFDKGNFPESWSAMLGFKRDIIGGHLVIPAYDLSLEIADGSITWFDGQQWLHGVTPYEKHSQNGYRYTIVFYSLKDLWRCLSPQEEIEQAREYRTKVEQKRRKGKAGEVEGDDG